MLELAGLRNVPKIAAPCNLGKVLVKTAQKENFSIQDGDILCVASKICSKAQGNIVDLKKIKPSKLAEKIHQQMPRKDARLIQVILEQTQDATGKRLDLADNYLGAWLPNGLFLTSGGVDKGENKTAITLPKDCDAAAKEIGTAFFTATGKRVAVIITDSDGRIDKKGATQIAVGLYGIKGLRVSNDGKKKNIETLCDMLAAAAGLIMGQRGTSIPVVRIRGLDYSFTENSGLADVVN
ncbi:coenzyme F420-0:L-glutamate ligase [Lactobacillus sp. ESL0791]|uniref:coenzyme F420-0:L-glutamate ligase n=1 Tax=Lactobacillus sp. ESL0791 TaxID=2983234 RepID=UPI0023F9A47B|nr:coenzyme F420-0:L-glutamate ligase [Lactobacillus sp. ESL0791]MDF7638056.1 coenzyme F420-0:L-glutamate ligase [Lactobacillus sp. ESL0791]